MVQYFYVCIIGVVEEKQRGWGEIVFEVIKKCNIKLKQNKYRLCDIFLYELLFKIRL